MRRKPVREENSVREAAQENGQALGADFCEVPGTCTNPRALLADLFHALNQPLAALRCSCELALVAPRTAEQYRDFLQTALEKSEQASLLAKGIREFVEAEDETGGLALISLREQVRDAAEYFLPVATEAGTTFRVDDDASFPRDDSFVEFHPEQLRRALFYIFDCTLALAAEKEVQIRVQNNSSRIILFLSLAVANAGNAFVGVQKTSAEETRRSPQDRNENHWQTKLHWAVAERLFRARQGTLVISRGNNEVCVEASLPAAKAGLRRTPLQ